MKKQCEESHDTLNQQGLFNSPRIRPMRKYHIDVRLLQSLQRALQSLDDMFPRETAGIGFLSPCPEEYLGNEDKLIARPRQFLQSFAHLDLTLTIGINLRSVKGIYSIVPCRFQNVFDDTSLLGFTIGQPSACIGVAESVTYVSGRMKLNASFGRCSPRAKMLTLRPLGPRYRKTLITRIVSK